MVSTAAVKKTAQSTLESVTMMRFAYLQEFASVRRALLETESSVMQVMIK